MTRIYDDGAITVTPLMLSTRSRIYPLVNATARLRNDPTIIAAAVSGLCAAALVVYGDLLSPGEAAVLMAAPAVCILASVLMGILVVDAVGQKPAVLITTRARSQKIFEALKSAQSAEFRRIDSFIDHPE
ncbi:hypothetical protein [Roseovarius sp.]|uniref:hypothetical protein n=1 Tax=Roseovarius sp. TaxID=1486281 RepID=UPI003A96B3B8